MSQPALVENDQFVAEPPEVGAKDLAEIGFGTAVRRTIVVGEIEMRDAEVESRPQKIALDFGGRRSTKIVPQAERQDRQLEAAPATVAILHFAVTVRFRCVGQNVLPLV